MPSITHQKHEHRRAIETRLRQYLRRHPQRAQWLVGALSSQLMRKMTCGELEDWRARLDALLGEAKDDA